MRKLFWLAAVLLLAGFTYVSLRDQLNQPKADVRETAALQSVETLLKAQKQYRSRYGRFAEHLYQLGPPRDAGGPDEQGAHLIPRDLASGKRLGYRFRARGYGDSFAVTAEPQSGAGELRSFFADQSGVIRENRTGPATASSPVAR